VVESGWFRSASSDAGLVSVMFANETHVTRANEIANPMHFILDDTSK
jgi:hypothetical protein